MREYDRETYIGKTAYSYRNFSHTELLMTGIVVLIIYLRIK